MIFDILAELDTCIYYMYLYNIWTIVWLFTK